MWRTTSILGTCLAFIVFALPNVLNDPLPTWLSNRVNLGLELRGGSHLQLQIDWASVHKDMQQHLLDDVRSLLRKERIAYVDLKSFQEKDDVIGVGFTTQDTQAKFAELLRQVDNTLQVSVNSGQVKITWPADVMQKRMKALLDQSIEVVRRRVDSTGTTEPMIQRQGLDRVLLQLPGVNDPSEVKRRLGQTAKMSFRIVDRSMPALPNQGSSTSSVEYLPSQERNGQTIYYPVLRQVMVSGDALTHAQANVDQRGMPCVDFALNSMGATKFATLSTEHEGEQLAIVLDQRVISAPVLHPIPNGKGQITGSFTIQEANELALLLRAGALPAPLKVVEERTVGPSLGADSIHHGKVATFLAFLLVSIFMMVSYHLFGFFADIALVFNLIGLFAGLSLLQATLTLPGIAGIALTIGMAVDANVLIYERIKEELRNGVRVISAIEAGYRRAMTTILDANITTLIGAFVLFEWGTGPIRGFAVTLALGIVVSLFTALSLSKWIITLWVGRRKLSTLPI